MDAGDPSRAHLHSAAATTPFSPRSAIGLARAESDEDRSERSDADGDHPPLRNRSRSLKAESLRSDLDAFAAKLASIRSTVAARSLLETEATTSVSRLPVINPKADGGHTLAATATAERLRLPLLRRIEQAKQQKMPPRDPYVAVDGMATREVEQDKFLVDSTELTAQEQATVTALRNANQIAEQVRVAAVAFTKNERNWPFDERTRRYHELLALKKQEEGARAVADKERTKAQQHRSLLNDPYGKLRVMSASPRTPLAPIEDAGYTSVWVLASPLPSLPFTPREETLQGSIKGEKELSAHVVYYIAPSPYTDKSSQLSTAPEQDAICHEDRPPPEGWISCSSHGVSPSPQVMRAKSSIETWTVQGAGASHVNGRYIACGAHDMVRKFKSSNGVELFRKRIPIMSALAQSLYDGPCALDTTSSDHESEDNPDCVTNLEGTRQEASVLPSALKSIEKDEHNFRSMQRVGAWLGMNEENERFRRMREDATHTSNSSLNDAASDSDVGSAILTKRNPKKIRLQSERSIDSLSARGFAQARQESCAPVCKEWVLFLKCSKRETASRANEASPPPQKPGLDCLYRHYYISVDEKIGMTIWAQGKEYLLEKSVLSAIISREDGIKTIRNLCIECMMAYQQNLRSETEAVLAKILPEMNCVRLLSIKVLETIEVWRAYIRRLGFTHYQPANNSSLEATTNPVVEANTNSFLLGWSATITVSTGKQLYKGSKAFVSQIKRFCRPEDPAGKKEQHIVYLGYFKTRVEAERAYDEFAASEARRLNTTAMHLPRRRGVFRSCGKHFAVESERLGPSFCIECKTQALASSPSSSSSDWSPPFYYTPGENYILKMAEDLDFLDEIPPLKSLLNDGRGSGTDEPFPLRGNALLIPRDPVYDINLMSLTSLGVIEASANGQQVYEAALDHDRIANAQQILLQELSVYRPTDALGSNLAVVPPSPNSRLLEQTENISQPYRVVQALYWDRCTAFQIRQQRPPLAFRQENVWCRPDAGEWASLIVRGVQQLHQIFETNLAAAGREMQKKRKELLKVMRKTMETPLYFIHDRSIFIDLISAGQTLKGDVVHLEVNNLTKQLARYDAWCASCRVVQRDFRRHIGRKRAATRLKALRQACSLRIAFMKSAHSTARVFYDQEVVAVAVRRAVRKISTPVYRCAVKKDGEMLIVSVHPLFHYRGSWLKHGGERRASSSHQRASPQCCASCARRFRVRAVYGCERQTFSVIQGVCTCNTSGNDEPLHEKWFLRAYNPVNNIIYRAEIGNDMLSQLMGQRINPYETITRGRSVLQANHCNPIRDMQHSQHASTVALVQTSYREDRVSRAYRELLNWKRLNNEAVQVRKTASIRLANCIADEEKTQTDFNASIVHAKKAMNFSGRAFSEAQAWDPLENANDWRLIVEKRRLERQLQECRQETERSRVACFQATYNELYTRVRVAQTQVQYDSGWLPMIEHQHRAMEDTVVKETTSRAVVECLIRRLCFELLLLREKGVPLRRQLIICKPVDLDTVAIRVALPEFHRQRNCVRRRVLHLKNHEKNKEDVSKRMVVSVFTLSRNGGSRGSKHYNTSAWWVSAYDSIGSMSQELFLEWEIVQLLVGWKVSNGKQDDRLLPRSAKLQIADKLLSIAMLDRFTDEFTLRKLQFYQQMRLVHPQICASKWFHDLRCGRKSGRGDEVLRQGTSISGRLGVIVIFENWGDLSFEFYHAATGRSYEAVVPLYEVSKRLSRKPLLLRLWASSVISNSYTPALLKQIVSLLAIEKEANDAQAERLNARAEHGEIWRKCFQGVRTIQKRRVLVSVREDASRDFRVIVFDLESNHTYLLEMEREALAKIFKERTGSSGSCSHKSLMRLLLQRNRNRLYEWIADHLQFQSLMEHPAALSSSLSPLVRGSHVRGSLQMLNRWFSSHDRIRVETISRDEIDRLASESETSAISTLLFDQLALIPDAVLPFEMNKQQCGTLEWNDVGLRSVSREVTHLFPFMKFDVYMQSHNLMLRLRREMFVEAEQRRQKTARDEMEQEEAYSLAVATYEVLVSTQQALRQLVNGLQTVREVIDLLVAKWEEIHAELLQIGGSGSAPRTPTARVADDDALSFGSVEHAESIKRLCVLMNTEVLVSPYMLDTLRSSVRDGVSVPLQVVSIALKGCLDEITGRAAERLQTLVSDYESTEDGSSSQRVSRLHLLRRAVLSFDRSFFGLNQPPSKASILTGRFAIESLDHPNSHNVERAPKSTIQTSPPADYDGALVMCTALLIPEDPVHEMQEVFLSAAVTSFLLPGTRANYKDWTRSLTSALRSTFREQLASVQRGSLQVAGALICRRVADGFLVNQDIGPDGSIQLARNPRANAIARQSSIHGLAIYVPFSPELRSSIDLRRRLPLGSEIYAEFAESIASALTDPSPTTPGRPSLLDKRQRIRSAKFLPWKQSANDRMRVARMLKRSLAAFGRSVVELAAETREREDATVVTASLSFRQLESMTGRVLTDSASLEIARGMQFIASRAVHSSRSGHGGWKVDVANARVLTNILVDTIDYTGNATNFLKGDSNAQVDMSAILVEVDDVRHPRRLVFSCRDLQSRRRYVVDCGYYDLYRYLLMDETSVPATIGEVWRRRPTTVKEWRSLAQLAAQHLVFRKANGTLMLCFDFADQLALRQPNIANKQPSTNNSETTLPSSSPQEYSKPSQQHTDDFIELFKGTIDRCCSQRLAAHQRAILRFVAMDQAQAARSMLLIRRHEWVSMILEDQRSQMVRGLLVLDTKELTRIRAAHGNGTLRANKQCAKMKSSSDRGNSTQLTEICKALGLPGDSVDGIRCELDAIRKERRLWQMRATGNKSAEGGNIGGSRDEQWPLGDIAEWWRRHLVQMAVAKAIE